MRGFDISSTTPLRSALIIGAHSDDIEIGAGGTVRRLLEANPTIELTWVVFSASGAREKEARASAESILGQSRHRVETFAFRDGFFPYEGLRVKEAFEAVRKTCEPDLVITHHREDLHQDHRLVGELTWNTFRDHIILEYEVPKFDGGLTSPNFFVPLSEQIVASKVAGLMAHFATQRNKNWFTEETFRGLMRLRGIECRSTSGYAEGFHCRKISWQSAAVK